VKGRKDLVASAAYLPEPAAVAAARKFVRDTLRSWLDTAPGAETDGGLVDDAVLLTSELVTNAVVHAGTQVQVTCKLAAGAVEVVVRDSHPARMVPGPAPDDTVPAERTGGRGLLLPSALAAAWGVSYGTDAKAVWFRMGLPGAPGEASAAGGDPGALEAVVPAGPWNVSGSAPEGAPPASASSGSAPAGSAPAGPLSAGPVPVSPVSVSPVPAGPAPVYNVTAKSGYDALLDQCVASARLIASADSAYALVADEDGDLGVRAASGLGPAAWLRTAPSVSTVPFMVDGQVTGVLAVAAARPGRFAEGEVRRLQQLADQMAPALERARLAELERARRARIGVLAEAGALLAGPLDQDRILAVAGQVAVPRLAAWCAVLLSGPGGDLRLTVARHADDSQAGALTWLLNLGCDCAPPGSAAESRSGAARSWPLTALVPAQAPPGVADLAARGAWCFPLATRGGPLGLLILGGPHGGRPSREVQRLAEDLAARIALALENSRLTARQQQASDALRAALVPPELPRIPGVELAFAHDLPSTGPTSADVSRSDLSRADAGGGDFCDVFPVAGGRWRFAIGEVCGTGPATLTVTSLARNALRILGAAGLAIPAVLDRLNQLILDERAPGTFLTLVHGEIAPGDPAGVSLACAGQPLPLALRAQGRPETAAAPQPVLGVIEGQDFSAQDVTLDAGDLLLCVTDGVTRRRDGDRQLDDDDGLARLLAACTGLTADVVADKVRAEVRTFGGHPAVDGMAVLIIRAAT
jgi:serine phosphatase RsbU (regulator of sigma subunit)/anti-sigma regulatory factor (Ser/Thr protein kinase)